MARAKSAELDRPRQVFLSAEWRDLAMLNYEVNPRVLQKYVPAGTELDSFRGKTYVSLVGLRFYRTKLFGSVAVPFHTDFDEVNLRLYVRRSEGDELRRGVVFIAEVVPRRAVAIVARVLYGENYFYMTMQHSFVTKESSKFGDFRWKLGGRWCELVAASRGVPSQPTDGNLEQFITEHYWGYSKQRRGRTLEYHVAHVPWNVWIADSARFTGDATARYGAEVGKIIQQTPDSVFLANGSALTVYKGKSLKIER